MKNSELKTRMLSREIHPNIYKITLPLPGRRPGPVNAYLFIGNNITLLDTGIPLSINLLRKALKEHHLKFSDIDQIVLTHGHIDHYGALKKMKDRGANAVVLAHIEDIVQVETGTDVPGRSYNGFLKLMGVPIISRMGVCAFFIFTQLMPLSCKVNSPLRDGDILELGDYSGKIITTPGHTRGSICLYLEKEKILFSGDHILAHITPNAFPMLETDSHLPLRMSQVEFFDSLKKIKTISPSIIYPAHGKTILNLDKTISMYKRCFSERQKNILSILKTGEQNVYRIARKLFPALDKKRFFLEIYLAVSEVYTHLQVLEQKKKAVMFMNNKMINVKMTEEESWE